MKLKGLIFLILAMLALTFASCVQDASADGHIHQYTQEVVAPTCTEQGYTVNQCACGDKYNDKFVKALGHKGEWRVVSVANCENDGKQSMTCTACFEIVEQKLPKLGHNYSGTLIDPTCSQMGHVKNICQGCGAQYIDSYVPATEKHEKGDPVVTKYPTCQQDGERIYPCKYCGKTLTTEPMAKLEGQHNYIAVSDKENNKTVYTCSMCDHSYTGEYISAEALAQSTAKEIYQNAKDAMIEIIAIDKAGKPMTIGSGFFISADGYIATNYHVIKGAYSLSVTKYTGEASVASVKVCAYNDGLDIAILKIETTGEKYLEFATSPVETGDTIYTLGSSYGLTNTFTYGMVSNADRLVNGKQCVQFTAPISGGNSGGPLLDASGKVIGIVTMQILEAQNINFAVKSATVESIFAQKLDTPLDPSTVYETNLKENAFHVLKYYIKNNYTTHVGDLYSIIEYEPETEINYGRKYTYAYDDAADRLYIQIEIILSNMSRLSITVDFDEDNDGMFAVDAYDYEYYQSTMVGFLDHTARLYIMSTNELNQEYFDSVFSDVETKYTGTNADIKKMGLYVSYSSLVQKFGMMLNNTGTGLSASSFDLSLPETAPTA